VKKIILHLGLPKTASTTLQHHLFQKLHDEKKINFLGKVVDFDEHNKPTWKNKTGHIIRDACEGKIVRDITSEVDMILRDDMLNVYSDEGIMVCYPGLKNLSLEKKLSNLKIILKDYDVTVLLSLRNPIDYFYSLYVQLFPRFYYNDKIKNTFEKHINSYLSDRENILYESFHYPKVLEMVFSKFDTKIILFEDMKNDVQSYCSELANLLELDILEIKNHLENKHENKKEKHSTGTYNGIYTTTAPFKNYIKSLFKKDTSLYKTTKYIYNLKILTFEIFPRARQEYKEVFHKKPNQIQIDALSKTLLLKNNFNFNKYNLIKEKLAKYGYIKTNVRQKKEIM